MPASAAVLTQGTKEFLIVDMVDKTGLITDMGPTSPTYDVYNLDDSIHKYTAISCVTNTMKVLCLIDTTSGGVWTTYNSGDPVFGAKQFKLYITFTNGLEVPKVGPFYFTVDPS